MTAEEKKHRNWIENQSKTLKWKEEATEGERESRKTVGHKKIGSHDPIGTRMQFIYNVLRKNSVFASDSTKHSNEWENKEEKKTHISWYSM